MRHATAFLFLALAAPLAVAAVALGAPALFGPAAASLASSAFLFAGPGADRAERRTLAEWAEAVGPARS